MRHSEVYDHRRTDRYRDAYPVLTELHISGRLWHRFRDMLDECDTAKLVDHYPRSGQMVAVIACLDDEVAGMLADGWET